MDEDDKALLVLGLMWAWAKYDSVIVPSLERFGARIYDVTHDDAGHKKDLPANALSMAQLRALMTEVGFADPNVAAAIAKAESDGYPDAVGDHGKSFGLFQIDTVYHKGYTQAELQDPHFNARVALRVSKGGTDWRPWSTWWADPKARTGAGQGKFRRYL